MIITHEFDTSNPDHKEELDLIQSAGATHCAVSAVLIKTREILKYGTMQGKTAEDAADEIRALIYEELGPWSERF